LRYLLFQPNSGTNHDEGSVLSPAKADWTPADLDAYVRKTFSTETADKILKQYNTTRFQPRLGGSPSFWAGATILTDYAMSCSARRSARWYSGKNDHVFLYFYTHELEVIKLYEELDKGNPMGVFHGSELVMVFDDESFLKAKEERQLSKTFAHLWASFADMGDPTPAGQYYNIVST